MSLASCTTLSPVLTPAAALLRAVQRDVGAMTLSRDVHLCQRSANFGPWAKSCPLPVCVNFIGKRPHSFMCVLSMAAVLLQ